MLTYFLAERPVLHILGSSRAIARDDPEQEASMSAVTYPAKSFTLSSAAPSVAGKPAHGLLARMLEAVITTRAAQAEREVARHLAFRGHDPHVSDF